MEKMADVLKVFLEKHLFPTIISISGAIVIYYVLPDDNEAILKLGKTLFIVLAFCCCFLVVQLVVKLVTAIKSACERARENGYYEKQGNEENRRKGEAWIEELNGYVDSLSPKDKGLLLTFVTNGNKTLIAVEAKYSYSGNSLLRNENIINRSPYAGSINDINENTYWLEASVKRDLSNGFVPMGETWQYKVKDRLYHDFELLYKQQGKLGNFE